MRFRPRVAAPWARFKVHDRYFQTFYHLTFEQDTGHRGPARLVLDGRPLQDERLPLVNDQRDHIVEVVFGPCAAESP